MNIRLPSRDHALVISMLISGAIGGLAGYASVGHAQPSAVTADAQSGALQSQARALFIKRCSRCHGVKGDGRGSFSSQLPSPPPDFTSTSWRAQVTPKYLRRAIIGGGRAIKKSLLMPAHPDLRNKRDLLNALIQHVLSLAEVKDAPQP